MNQTLRTLVIAQLVVAGVACRNLAPPAKITLPQTTPGSTIQMHTTTETQSYTGTEKVGELCSQTTGTCFDQMQATSGSYEVPVARFSMDGQPLDEAQVRALGDPDRDKHLTELAQKTSNCVTGRRFLLGGLIVGGVGAVSIGPIGGTAGLAIGGSLIALGVAGIAYGSIKGAWSCGATVEMHDKLDLAAYVGKDKTEGADSIKEIEALAASFNDRVMGKRVTSNTER